MILLDMNKIICQLCFGINPKNAARIYLHMTKRCNYCQKGVNPYLPLEVRIHQDYKHNGDSIAYKKNETKKEREINKANSG